MAQSGVESMSGESKKDWRGFWAAWLGWAFDGMDGFLYTLVALPFVAQLLGKGASTQDVAAKAGLIQGVFMFGWALGGAVFGRLGDRLGRCRTLTLTIVTYAVFTGLSFFATEWWHLLIFRFVAALGIGGEWAAGSSLVSETVDRKHRAWASATLQSGYMVGMLLAAFAVRSITGHGAMEQLIGKSLDYRYVFLVGVLPAFVTIWIRKAVPEPEEWQNEKSTESLPSIGTLFGPQIRATTLLTLTMTAICLTTVWSFLFFSNQVVRALPDVKGLAKQDVEEILFWTTILWTSVNIVANFAATYTAKLLGYRNAMALFLTGAFLVFFFGFRTPHDLMTTRIIFCAAACFSLGIFAIFPLYIPPLFPTLLRTTGAGFCYNAGRVAAGFGALYGGQLVGKQFPGMGIWWTSFLYIPGILLALFMPIIKEED